MLKADNLLGVGTAVLIGDAFLYFPWVVIMIPMWALMLVIAFVLGIWILFACSDDDWLADQSINSIVMLTYDWNSTLFKNKIRIEFRELSVLFVFYFSKIILYRNKIKPRWIQSSSTVVSVLRTAHIVYTYNIWMYACTGGPVYYQYWNAPTL